MPSLLGIAGGIAASPFRAAGMAAKGTAKLGYAGAKGLAFTAMDVSGALPLFAGAAGVKKGITAGYKKGKELLRPIGAGAVAEDSALAAIAAAASETAKIDAETERIEAKTAAITGTSMGGIDVEILEKIYGEVVSIRGIIGDKDPESEKKELALDETVRHRNFLKALAALGFSGKGDKKVSGPSFFGNLLDSFKKFLPLLIAGLGLGGLVALWPKLQTAFESIANAIANINEFITDMRNFFAGAWDWLSGEKIDLPATMAAAAAAAAMRAATRDKYRNRTFQRGTPQRKLTKGQNRLIAANEKVKEAKRLRALAERKRIAAAEARRVSRMRGPGWKVNTSQALATYKRSTTAGSRGRMMTSVDAEIEARRALRWRTSIGRWMQSNLYSMGQGLAEYNLERAKAAQLADTKRFLEASRKSEMKLRKVVMRAFTGERIMTQAQIEGIKKSDLKVGRNVLIGDEQANARRVFKTTAGRSNLTRAEILNLRKVGYNVTVKEGTADVRHTAKTGKSGTFVGEGEIRANADSRYRRVHRLASAGVQAKTGVAMKTSVTQAMVQEAHIASQSGAAGKWNQRLAGRGFRMGTRIFGTALIGVHLAKQMGDYYVEAYLPEVAHAKGMLKIKLGREPTPNELKTSPAVIKSRQDLQRMFHTIGIMAASGVVVGALMAQVGAVIGTKVGALIGGLGMNPASVALGAVIGGLVGGVVFAFTGYVLGEVIAGATIAGADKMVDGNFIPAGAEYMPFDRRNIGDWYAEYLIGQENKNFAAKQRQHKAEALLQKDMTELRESLGMGKDKGLGSKAMAVAMNLKRKAATAEGLTDSEQVVLNEYLQRVEGGKAKAAHLKSISGTSMMGGTNYSQTTPTKPKTFLDTALDTAKDFLGIGDQSEGGADVPTSSVPTADLWDAPAALSMIPHSERSFGGGDLMSLGKNGGVPSADVIVTNISNTTNSDQQTVTSTARTSNIISFDKKSASVSPMRNRFATSKYD